MVFLENYIKIVDKLNTKLGSIISWITVLLVLVVCYDVFTRYFLNISSVAVQELEWHLFAALFLMGAAHTLKNDGHVRVDLFYSKLKPKGKAAINIIGTVLFLIPFCLLVIFSSKNFVLNSFNLKEISPDPGGLPARYILKAVLPVSFFFVLIQSLSLLFKSILTIFNNSTEVR
jgi:TRAP-type mannitol/chloroaromatic compound transport system permease small subunit